jgi:hypothetical protein
MGSRDLIDVKSGAPGGSLSEAVAFEGQPVSVVDELVEDGVGDGWIGDGLMPLLDRQLAGDDGRAAAVAIIDDLEEVASLIGGQTGEPPIVEDEQFDAGDGFEQACMAAVAAREGERVEQPWHPVIEHRAIVSAGRVRQGTVARRPSPSTFSAMQRRPALESLRASAVERQTHGLLNYCSKYITINLHVSRAVKPRQPEKLLRN